MTTKSTGSFAISLTAGLFLMCETAFAVPITVVQNYSIGVPGPLGNTLITTTARFDDSSVTGIGTEFVGVDSVGLEFTDRAIPGETAGFTFTGTFANVLPFASESDIDAVFRNGVYSGLATGFALFSGFPNPNPQGILIRNLISFNVSAGTHQGTLSVTISNAPTNKFKFLGAPIITQDPVGGPSPVPLPATLPLFVMGIAGLGAVGWRRRRGAARLSE